MRNVTLVMLFLVLTSVSIHAQVIPGSSTNPERTVSSLEQWFGHPQTYRSLSSSLNEGERKSSIPLAFVLSAVLPGAGQAYNRQWVKAGIFAGIEIGTLAAQYSFNKRGNDGEVEYQNTAHSGWSAINYASWLNGYTGYNGPEIMIPPAVTGLDLSQPSSWTAAESQAVRQFFDAIREAERRSVHISTGASFSHQLPYFGEQQYYELIGKYYQYAPGWQDYNGADDPEEENEAGQKVNASQRFLSYADDHQRSNGYLRKASRLSAVLVINHFISAFEAAISAKLKNNRIESSISFLSLPNGELKPVIQAGFRF